MSEPPQNRPTGSNVSTRRRLIRETPTPTPISMDDARTRASRRLLANATSCCDRLLRKTAEFDNYRKRVDKERREQSRVGGRRRAHRCRCGPRRFRSRARRRGAAGSAAVPRRRRADSSSAWRVAAQARRHAARDAGRRLRPHLHQAVAYEETPGAREGEVVGELRKGYRLGERLLRPALVRVAKAS